MSCITFDQTSKINQTYSVLVNTLGTNLRTSGCSLHFCAVTVECCR